MARRRSLFFKQTPTLPGFGLSFGVSTLYLALIILLPVSALFIYCLLYTSDAADE